MSKEEAVARIKDHIELHRYHERNAVKIIEALDMAIKALEGSAECEFCKNRGLEDGDTLYISADWDGGIGFDYIRNIHYCPKCGRRL